MLSPLHVRTQDVRTDPGLATLLENLSFVIGRIPKEEHQQLQPELRGRVSRILRCQGGNPGLLRKNYDDYFGDLCKQLVS